MCGTTPRRSRRKLPKPGKQIPGLKPLGYSTYSFTVAGRFQWRGRRSVSRMKLFPREEKFFQYFQQQADFICEAAKLLVEGAVAGNARLASAAHQIRAIEEQADTVIHDIFTMLNSSFI